MHLVGTSILEYYYDARTMFIKFNDVRLYKCRCRDRDRNVIRQKTWSEDGFSQFEAISPAFVCHEMLRCFRSKRRNFRVVIHMERWSNTNWLGTTAAGLFVDGERGVGLTVCNFVL